MKEPRKLSLTASFLTCLSALTLTLPAAHSAMLETGGVTYTTRLDSSLTPVNAGKPFNIAGSDGLYWSAQNGDAQCILVCVHGMSLCAESFTNFAQIMSKKDMSVYSVQLRGFGKDQFRPGKTKLSLEQSVIDVENVLREIRTQNPDKPVFLVGESLGGCLGMQLAARCPNLLDGVVCSAPAWHSYQFKRTILRGLADSVYKSHGRVGWAAEDIIKLATHNQKLLHHWETDPDYRYKYSFKEEMNGLRFMGATGKVARQITSEPMLVIQGLDDRLVRAKGTADLFKRIPSSDKELVLVADNEHLSLQEVKPKQEVIDVVSKWLMQKSAERNLARGSSGEKAILIGYSNLAKAEKLFRRAGLQPTSPGLASRTGTISKTATPADKLIISNLR